MKDVYGRAEHERIGAEESAAIFSYILSEKADRFGGTTDTRRSALLECLYSDNTNKKALISKGDLPKHLRYRWLPEVLALANMTLDDLARDVFGVEIKSNDAQFMQVYADLLGLQEGDPIIQAFILLGTHMLSGFWDLFDEEGIALPSDRLGFLQVRMYPSEDMEDPEYRDALQRWKTDRRIPFTIILRMCRDYGWSPKWVLSIPDSTGVYWRRDDIDNALDVYLRQSKGNQKRLCMLLKEMLQHGVNLRLLNDCISPSVSGLDPHPEQPDSLDEEAVVNRIKEVERWRTIRPNNVLHDTRERVSSIFQSNKDIMASVAAKMGMEETLRSKIKAGTRSLAPDQYAYICARVAHQPIHELLFNEDKPVRLPVHLNTLVELLQGLTAEQRHDLTTALGERYKDKIQPFPYLMPRALMWERAQELCDERHVRLDLLRNTYVLLEGERDYYSKVNPSLIHLNNIIRFGESVNTPGIVGVIQAFGVSADYILNMDYTTTAKVQYRHGDDWLIIEDSDVLVLLSMFLRLTTEEQDEAFIFIIRQLVCRGLDR